MMQINTEMTTKDVEEKNSGNTRTRRRHSVVCKFATLLYNRLPVNSPPKSSSSCPFSRDAQIIMSSILAGYESTSMLANSALPRNMSHEAHGSTFLASDSPSSFPPVNPRESLGSSAVYNYEATESAPSEDDPYFGRSEDFVKSQCDLSSDGSVDPDHWIFKKRFTLSGSLSHNVDTIEESFNSLEDKIKGSLTRDFSFFKSAALKSRGEREDTQTKSSVFVGNFNSLPAPFISVSNFQKGNEGPIRSLAVMKTPQERTKESISFASASVKPSKGWNYGTSLNCSAMEKIKLSRTTQINETLKNPPETPLHTLNSNEKTLANQKDSSNLSQADSKIAKSTCITHYFPQDSHAKRLKTGCNLIHYKEAGIKTNQPHQTLLNFSKKRKILSESLSVEHKQEKQNNFFKNDTIVNTEKFQEKDRKSAEDHVLGAQELLFTLVYSNGLTQLRGGSSQSQQIKKLAVASQLNDAFDSTKLESFKPQKVFLFSLNSSQEDYLFWTRNIIQKMMVAKNRKVAFDVQEVISIFFQNIFSNYLAKENMLWNIMDPKIAAWLLDPDNPPITFEHITDSLNIKKLVDRNETYSILSDFTFLSLAMYRLQQKLRVRKLWDLYFFVEIRLPPLLAAMQLRKIKVDVPLLLKFSDILKRKLTKLEKKAHQIVGHCFLLSSHHQLRQVLYEELKLDQKVSDPSKIVMTNGGHQKSTSEAVLNHLIHIHPLPVIILEYRQLQKLKSTYVDGILSCTDGGYISTHWNQTVAATGRLISAHPNIQSIPKMPVIISDYTDNYILDRESTDQMEILARDSFISHEGWSFLAADFQQIELRLLAHLTSDPLLLKLFKDEVSTDIFIALASQWLRKPLEDVTTSEREQAKRIVYSIMYGVGKEKLGDYLKISGNEAKEIISSFLKRFPAVNSFTNDCKKFCCKNGYTCTIFKRRRMFPNIRHHVAHLRAQAARQAVNFCVQGSAADLCKVAMLQVNQEISQNSHFEASLLVQIHDELLMEVSDKDLVAVKGVVKKIMESSANLCGNMVTLTVPLKVSLSSGKRWGHLETIS